MKNKKTQLMEFRLANRSARGTFAKVAGAALLVVMNLLFSRVASGQGWQYTFGAEKTDEGWAVLQTEDHGFLVVGFGESFGTDNDQDIFVIRTDADGTKLWSTYFDEGYQEQARAILATADGNYLIVGNIISEFGQSENVYLLKINRKGEKIWSKQFGSSNAERVQSAILDKDGGFLVTGSIKAGVDNEDAFLARFDAQGNIAWFKQFDLSRSDVGVAVAQYPQNKGLAFVCNGQLNGLSSDIVLYRLAQDGTAVWERRIAGSAREEARDLVVTADNGIVLTGAIGNNPNAYAVKFGFEGDKLWETSIGQSGIEEESNAIAELNDGSLILTGLKVVNQLNVDIFLAKLGADGRILWQKNIGDPEAAEEARDVRATADGGFVLTGYNAQMLTSFNDLILVKTDGQGNIVTNQLSGRVFRDLDSACDSDANEPGLEGWLVMAEQQGKVFYATTDAKGAYRISVDTGRYNVRAIPVNLYWDACIAQGTTVQFKAPYDSIRIDFPMKSALACPFLEVEVATPFLAPCSDLDYFVSYRNIGTGRAEKAYVDLQLDRKIRFNSASVPHILLSDGKYRFQLGTLEPTASGKFSIKAEMACTGIAEGQAALVSAHIYPDTTCLQADPNWDMSSLTVSGTCEGDSVSFKIKNEGQGDMESARRSIVIQDAIILRQFDVQLKADEERTIKVPATGATFRIVVQQSSGHPGRSFPTAVVEACSTGPGSLSFGKVTMFPEDNFDPFVAIDAQEIKTFALPVELRGYPKGYRDSIIAPETDLTFKVLFKNSSTDTVRRVVIRDTLPQGLDPRRVTPGASNFSYRLEVTSTGVVKITLDNVALAPAGNANTGFGFVEFRVGQKANNLPGTVIENRATVYFDYQAPAATKALRYVVQKFPDFITVLTSAKETFMPGLQVKAYPNPAVESVTFELEGPGFDAVALRVLDLNGRLVDQHLFSGHQFTWSRNGLPSGMYLYRLESRGKLINSGKFIIR